MSLFLFIEIIILLKNMHAYEYKKLQIKMSIFYLYRYLCDSKDKRTFVYAVFNLKKEEKNYLIFPLL